MKLNNFAVSVMNFFVKLSFWVITVLCVAVFFGALSEGNFGACGMAVAVWAVGVLFWALLSAGWLVLSKMAAHLESIDRKTPERFAGFDDAEGDSKSV